MNPLELALRARAFRQSGAFTDPEAAAALGVSLSTFCRLKNQRYVGDPFSHAEIARRLRGGSPIEIALTPAEFTRKLRDYRARHGFSQRDAGLALGCHKETLRGWESGDLPSRFALPEILRRLALPVHAEAIKAACKPKPLIPADELAARLRAWRRRHKLTRRMAGEALGIHERTVCAWEQCAQFPGAPLLTRILPLLAAKPSGVRSTHGWLARRPSSRDRTFGPRLRAWRKARGLNQLAAALALGLPRDQALICDYERGKAFPRPERLAHILAIIGETEVQP